MSEIQGKPVYGICDCKERRQVLSVDQVADLIQQMATNEWQVPDGYIPKTSVNGIIEQNHNKELIIWKGTQSEYDAWDGDKDNTYPIITDDPTLAELKNQLSKHDLSISNAESNITKILDGKLVVPNAKNAVHAVLNSDGSFSDCSIIRHENGVLEIILPIQKVWISIDEELSSAVGTSQIKCSSNKSFTIGDTFTYQDETAEIVELGESGTFTVNVATYGAIDSAIGTTIYLDEYISSNYIVPCKKRIKSKSMVKYSEGDTIATDEFVNSGDIIEIEVKNWGVYKFRVDYGTSMSITKTVINDAQNSSIVTALIELLGTGTLRVKQISGVMKTDGTEGTLASTGIYIGAIDKVFD